MRRRNHRTAGYSESPRADVAERNRSAEHARNGSEDPKNGMDDWRLERVADCLVLSILAIGVVLVPPRTEFLSFQWCGPSLSPPMRWAAF